MRKQRKLIPLNQQDFKMKIIKDLGMQHIDGASRQYRSALFECNSCKEPQQYTAESARYKKVKVCLKCSYKNRAEKTAKHGDYKTRLYKIHKGIKTRCLDSNGRDFKRYGAKGITVCDEWLDYLTFKEWALSNGYCENLSIDRIDNNKGYRPDNCRWADDSIQVSNRQKQKRNKTGFIGIEKRGESFSLGLQYRHKYIIRKTFSNIYKAAIVRDAVIKLYNLPHVLNLPSPEIRLGKLRRLT